MATAGLRRAGAGAGRRRWFLRTVPRRAEDRKLLFHGAAVALGAMHMLARGENDLFEAMMTASAIVFEDRHSSSLSLGMSHLKSHIEFEI
jgi:hypothetical protein